MQDSFGIGKKRRGNLQWALALILFISLGAFVTDYFEYRLTSVMLDGIHHLPPLKLSQKVEEAIVDIEDTQEKIRWRTAQHLLLVSLALVGLWNVPRKDVGGLTNGKQEDRL